MKTILSLLRFSLLSLFFTSLMVFFASGKTTNAWNVADDGLLPTTNHVTVGLGTETLDQQQLHAYYYTASNPQWQSITAGITGNLTKIGFVVYYRGTYALTIYSGTGTGGTLLYSQSVNLSIGYPSMDYVVPSTPVPVLSGSTYTIQLAGSAGWTMDNTNSYSGGYSNFGSNWDQTFRTYVTPPPTDVLDFKVVFHASNGITPLQNGEVAYFYGGSWINTGLSNGGVTPDSGIVVGTLNQSVTSFRMRYANTETYANVSGGVVNFQTCLAQVKLLSSGGAKLSGGTVYLLGNSGWSLIGTTDTSGTVKAELLPGNHYYYISYGTSAYQSPAPQDICAPFTLNFINTKINLRSSTNAKLAGGAISYLLNGNWQFIGTTDTSGSVSVDLLPANYYFKVVYANTQLISGSISNSSPITFTTCKKYVWTITILDEQGIAGASGYYLGIAGWSFMGTTDVTGMVSAELLPGDYYFEAVIGATVKTKGIPTSTCVADTFFVPVASFFLKSSTGAPLAGGAFFYWTGTWTYLATTDATGAASALLLPGNYSMMVQYAGTMIYQGYRLSTTTDTVTTCDFRTTIKNGSNSGIIADVYYLGYNGWNTLGTTDTSGFAHKQVLPGSYHLVFVYPTGVYRSFEPVYSCVPYIVRLAFFNLQTLAGVGLPGGDFYYWSDTGHASGYWTYIGTSDYNGVVRGVMAPGYYQLKIDYAFTRYYTPGWHSTANSDTFHTCDFTLTVERSSGVPIVGATVQYLGYNGWDTMGVTNGLGVIQKELMPGSYSLSISWDSDGVTKYIIPPSPLDACTPHVVKAPKVAAPDFTLNTDFGIYPNPVSNGNVNFTYSIDEEANVSISIYDTKGTKIADVLNSRETKGEHSLNWNTGELNSGVYFCRFQTNTVSKVKSLVIGK